jgi:hypothetical protein
MAHLVLGDAGIAARLALRAMQSLGFGGSAQTRAHKTLPGIAGWRWLFWNGAGLGSPEFFSAS